ncbi:hypothetical protein LH29_09870 [Draconibacterium sediminis]|uniref:DUF5916 domain-containing protein n=2 Tax=Draconibacterium sediminis TaxID=1544798 RepID=A0A0D8JFX6_9BACT|nr:hypothetical protein LH29_09870 [Draconibacterium sediminis]
MCEISNKALGRNQNNMKRTFILKLIPLVLCVFGSIIVFGQDVIQIAKNDGTLNFDGVPDEAFWLKARQFELIMHIPNFEAAPSEDTKTYISYDDNFLWVGAFLNYKNPENIVSTSKKRDEKSKNPDSFGILLDTYDDNENALAFCTMPAGQRIDFAVSNDAQMMPSIYGASSLNYSWNTFWDVKTARTATGWAVEMRIPFSSLRFQEVNGRVQMGLLINRGVSHNNEVDTYPATDPKYGRLASNKPSLAQTIELSGVESKKTVYVAPYITTGVERTNDLNEDETAFDSSKDNKLTGGVDIKYSLTSNLTMDLTFNTDFAQVEADDEQVNLTRYALFFPEKRMFFQERSSIFDYKLSGPSKLFYSRRIGLDEDGCLTPILGGARLTGRVGKWDMGFMDMQTQKNNGNPSENFGVLRFRRQVINTNSYVGAIITSRVGADINDSYSYGVDGIFRIFGDDYIEAGVAQTTDPEGTDFSGGIENTFYRASWQRRSEEGFAYDLSYAYTGENFDPQVGFLSKYATKGPRLKFQYGWLPGAGSKLFKYSIDGTFYESYRVTDGGLDTGMYGPGFSLNTKKGWFVNLDLNYRIEGVDEEFELDDNVVVPADKYKTYTSRMTFMSPVSKPLSTTVMMSGGQFYDGNNVTATVEPIYNLSASLQLSAYYNFSHVVFANRNQEMNAHVGRLKFLYMYNTKLSFSSFLQYNSVNNVTVANFRLRYNPKEGNDLYVVYNEIRPTSDYVDNGLDEPQFLNRIFQVKYVYTFQL